MPNPTATQPNLGQLIRALRHELRLTQEQFAHEIGVTFATVNRWENGHANPSPMALRLIEGKLKELGEKGDQDLPINQDGQLRKSIDNLSCKYLKSLNPD